MKKIFNIFSKRETADLKKLPENKTVIVIDNREKNSLVPSFLSSEEIKVIFKQLPIGDYIINEIAVERKTLADLQSSIINKRLVQQLSELKQYPKHLLIIEGMPNKDASRLFIHENALRGFLLSVVLEYNVPIMFTQDEEETAKYLFVLAKKSRKTDFSLRPKKQIKNSKEQVQFILEGFPGIGPKTAKILIKEFKTLKNIFDASELSLNKILGGKAPDFYKIINQVI